jgi:hypothetical protein
VNRPKLGSPENIAMLREGQRRAWERVKAGEGFMYVAEVVGTDLLKVGFSLDPDARMRWCGARFRLLGVFPASRNTEHAFHKFMQANLGAAKRSEVYSRSMLEAA